MTASVSNRSFTSINKSYGIVDFTTMQAFGSVVHDIHNHSLDRRRIKSIRFFIIMRRRGNNYILCIPLQIFEVCTCGKVQLLLSQILRQLSIYNWRPLSVYQIHSILIYVTPITSLCCASSTAFDSPTYPKPTTVIFI